MEYFSPQNVLTLMFLGFVELTEQSFYGSVFDETHVLM